MKETRAIGRFFPWWGAALAAAVLLTGLTAASAAGDQAGWTSLFDGKTTAGWTNPYDWGEVWVENGEIRLRSSKKFFLLTKKKYRDFILEVEIKMPEGKSNSGIMFRCHKKHNRVWGYQAEVDPSARQWSGGLYDEGRRGWLNPSKKDPATQKAFVEKTKGAFKRHDWNHYRIECKGDHIRIYVNGVLTTDYHDSMDREGYIGLQHHGEKGQVYRFRNIRIKEIEPAKGTGGSGK